VPAPPLRAAPSSKSAVSRIVGTLKAEPESGEVASAPVLGVVVEQPSTLALVVNLNASAKALGLTIPPAVLARVDRVIQ